MKSIAHVCLLVVLIAQSEALFLSGGSGSGNLKVSGNFHGLLKNHPILGSLHGSSSTKAPDVVVSDEPFKVDESPVTEDNVIAPVEDDANSGSKLSVHGSFKSSHNWDKAIV
jgi:hypothetical protein